MTSHDDPVTSLDDHVTSHDDYVISHDDHVISHNDHVTVSGVPFRYGVRQFVLIVPDEQTNPLHSQAQANLMLSSVSVAIANTGW